MSRSERFKKILCAAVVCAILALTFSSCGDKDKTADVKSEKVTAKDDKADKKAKDAAAKAETEVETETEAGDVPAPVISEEGQAPEESDVPAEEAQPGTPAPEAATAPVPEEVPSPGSGSGPAVTVDLSGAKAAAGELAALFAAADYESAKGLTAEGSQAYAYIDRRCDGSPAAILSPDTYARIKALANLADIDITTGENQALLASYARRLTAFNTCSSGEAAVVENRVQAPISVFMPEIKVGAAYSAAENYLTSIGTDMETVNAAAGQMTDGEKKAYMKGLADGFADYALNGGIDMSVKEELRYVLSLEQIGGEWLVTDIKYISE